MASTPDPQTDPVRCPKCSSKDIRYSHNRGYWDDVLNWLFAVEVFRCRKCSHRFHRRITDDHVIQERTANED